MKHRRLVNKEDLAEYQHNWDEDIENILRGKMIGQEKLEFKPRTGESRHLFAWTLNHRKITAV
jgi:hypothetical protein